MAILKDAEGKEIEVFTKDELKSELGTMITGAVRGQLDKKLDEVATKVGERLGLEDKFSKLNETLEGLRAAPAPKQEGNQNGTTPEPPRFEDSPAFKAQQLELQKLQKRLESSESEKAAERAKARAQALRQRTFELLSEHGVTGNGARYAFNNFAAEGRVVYEGDTSDELLFVAEKGEKLPIKDGIKSWVESEDAKVFLPPRGASGSGEEPRRPAGTGTKKSPLDYSGAEIGAALRSVMNGGIE